MRIVYLNGEYLPQEKACISVFDRGFTFGEGVYEVIPVFSGCLFRLEEHVQRLQSSLSAIDIKNPYTLAEWQAIFTKLLEQNPARGDQSVYVQVTRGVSERDHIYSSEQVPTVFAMCRTIVERDLSQGVTAITHADIRWEYCYIKATTLLPGVLLKNRAKKQDGSMEAILIRDGYVTEGAASNVFIVKNGVIKTPEKDGYVLPGITRDLLIELLHKAGIPCEETRITEAELEEADEIWITSSTIDIAPIVRLDGKPVGTGKTGAMWKRAIDLYRSFKKQAVEQ